MQNTRVHSEFRQLAVSELSVLRTRTLTEYGKSADNCEQLRRDSEPRESNGGGELSLLRRLSLPGPRMIISS